MIWSAKGLNHCDKYDQDNRSDDDDDAVGDPGHLARPRPLRKTHSWAPLSSPASNKGDHCQESRATFIIIHHDEHHVMFKSTSLCHNRPH